MAQVGCESPCCAGSVFFGLLLLRRRDGCENFSLGRFVAGCRWFGVAKLGRLGAQTGDENNTQHRHGAGNCDLDGREPGLGEGPRVGTWQVTLQRSYADRVTWGISCAKD